MTKIRSPKSNYRKKCIEEIEKRKYGGDFMKKSFYIWGLIFLSALLFVGDNYHISELSTENPSIEKLFESNAYDEASKNMVFPVWE